MAKPQSLSAAQTPLTWPMQLSAWPSAVNAVRVRPHFKLIRLMLRKTIFTVAILGFATCVLFARELKEFDNDVNYDEARVPRYDLPDPLITAEGKPVTTAEQWRNVRRPQILSLFANFIYGAVTDEADRLSGDDAHRVTVKNTDS